MNSFFKNYLKPCRWATDFKRTITQFEKPKQYLRTYKATLVYPDGSTVEIRHEEPRQIIKLPLFLEDCKDDASKSAWNLRRYKKQTTTVKEDKTDVQYNRSKYLKFAKKR